MDILVTGLRVSQRVQPQRDQRRLADTSFGIGPYTIQVEATPPGRPVALTFTLSSPRSASVTRLVSRVLQRLPDLSKRQRRTQMPLRRNPDGRLRAATRNWRQNVRQRTVRSGIKAYK